MHNYRNHFKGNQIVSLRMVHFEGVFQVIDKDYL